MTKKTFSGKQGIEVEMIVKDNSLGITNRATDIFAERVDSKTYYDDGKPEYPSNPHNNLGDLEDEIRNYLINVCDICKDKGWLISLIGSDPFRIDFASSHIHNSMEEIPTRKAIWDMRESLYSVQPFIALLSQNSQLSDKKITYCKDARLGYSVWSRFTNYDSRDPSHYLSLASGEMGHGKNKTLEVRIPSSSIIEQMFANLVFIKSFIQLDNVPILPLSQCKENFFKVVRYGGLALIPMLKPTGIGYLGVKGNPVYVKISELFNLILKDPDLESLITDSLSELSGSLRTKIIEFFDDITKGYTMSDFILQAYLSNPDEYMFQRLLDDLVNNSCKGESFKDLLEAPEKPFYPTIEASISLEELSEMLDKQNVDFIVDSDVNEVDRIITEIKTGAIDTFLVCMCIRALSSTTSISSNPFLSTPSIRKYLIDNEIMTEDNKQGRLFNAVLQGIDEMGLV